VQFSPGGRAETERAAWDRNAEGWRRIVLRLREHDRIHNFIHFVLGRKLVQVALSATRGGNELAAEVITEFITEGGTEGVGVSQPENLVTDIERYLGPIANEVKRWAFPWNGIVLVAHGVIQIFEEILAPLAPLMIDLDRNVAWLLFAADRPDKVV